MQIHYRQDISDVCWKQIAELFDAVGWGQHGPEDIQQAFSKSSFVRMAYDQDQIVGFGRTVDDGKYYGMIVDLVVDPAYQGKGIGSTILRQLREEMEGFRIIALTAASGKEAFYLKQGWKRQKRSFYWSRSAQPDHESSN